MEYFVWIHAKKTRIEEGDLPWTNKQVGRVVEKSNGFEAYRPHSGMGQVFSSKYDAVAYLVYVAGYTLSQVSEAYQLKNLGDTQAM